MFKQLNPGFLLKNTFQITLYAFQKIISDHQHVNNIYSSEILQCSHSLLWKYKFLINFCINPKSLIILSKYIFQLRDAYSSPQKDRWSQHTFQHPQDRQNFSDFLTKTGKETCLDIHLPDFINAANANMILTDLSIATDEKISSQSTP